MALFGRKKEDNSNAPDMNMQGDQGYGEYGQDYGGGYDQGYGQEAYPQQQYPMGQPGMQQPPGPAQPPAPELDNSRIEEVAEAIVEEKWREKRGEIDKIIEWRDQVNSKLTQLQQQINDLKDSFDSLHKGILGKISEYDENLINVGTEIKTMEKVFSKVLPSLTDSVNKLQRFSDSYGSVKKK